MCAIKETGEKGWTYIPLMTDQCRVSICIYQSYMYEQLYESTERPLKREKAENPSTIAIIKTTTHL